MLQCRLVQFSTSALQFWHRFLVVCYIGRCSGTRDGICTFGRFTLGWDTLCRRVENIPIKPDTTFALKSKCVIGLLSYLLKSFIN